MYVDGEATVSGSHCRAGHDGSAMESHTQGPEVACPGSPFPILFLLRHLRVWNCEIFLLEVSNRLERKSERQASSRSPRWSGKDPMGDTRDSSSWRRLASARVWIVWLGTTLGVGVRMTLASPTSNTVAPKIEPTKRSRLDFPSHGPYSSNPRNSLARHFSILS